MEFLTELGYLGLFIAAFLAATILPLGSEVVLIALALSDFTPLALLVVATVGNVLGSIINYALGYWLGKAWVAKKLNLSDKEFEQAEARYRKYGLTSMLLAWVPIIGDPLTVIAGILRVHFIGFLILVTIGKCARYLFILLSLGYF